MKFQLFSAFLTCFVAAAAGWDYEVVGTDMTEFSGSNQLLETPPAKGEPFYGQDAHYTYNTPLYVDNSDGTITDRRTKLMWQKTMTKYSFDEAFTAAKQCSTGGYTNWRVPTVKELYSLILFSGDVSSETAGTKRFIDTNYFEQPLGDTDAGEREIDAQTWTSNKYKGTTMATNASVFGVNFIDGRIKSYPMKKKATNTDNKMHFRFVRRNKFYGLNSFVDNKDGTITDEATGLVWMQADSGVGIDWKDALANCEDLDFAGHTDWKLPNAKELQTIVDYSRSPEATNSAAIDPIFSVTQVKLRDGSMDYPYFWLSTTHKAGARSKYKSAVYVAFGKAIGKLSPTATELVDAHGAGAQRSDPKSTNGNDDDYPQFKGPQNDLRVVYNYARCVRRLSNSSAFSDYLQ